MSWPMVKLKSLVTIKGGGTPSRKIEEFWMGDIPWVTVKDFKSSRLSTAQEFINLKGIENSATNLIKKGNIIVPTRMALGKVAINDVDIAINQDLKALIIKDSNTVNIDYLVRFLLSQSEVIINHGKGATVKGITLEVLQELEVPFPPLPIQKQIATALEKADTLRQQCQQMEQELNALAQSVFLEMFGDPIKNHKKWYKVSLSSVTDRIIDCPHTTPKWTSEGITCLRTTNLTNGGWNFEDHRFVDVEQYKERTSRSEIEPGDVILSREGTVGVAAIVDVGMKVCLGQRLVQVRPDFMKINSEFLLYQLLFLLRPERLTQVMSGSTVKHLNMSDIRSLEVIVPPIEYQTKFKQIWASIKSELGKANQQISGSEECFNSLMQRAFKGELHLTAPAQE